MKLNYLSVLEQGIDSPKNRDALEHHHVGLL